MFICILLWQSLAGTEIDFDLISSLLQWYQKIGVTARGWQNVTLASKPFASGDAHDWFKRFNICCRANAWDAATKALKLPTLLEGEVPVIWSDIEEEQDSNYDTAKGKIINTKMPTKFVSLIGFKQWKL